VPHRQLAVCLRLLVNRRKQTAVANQCTVLPTLHEVESAVGTLGADQQLDAERRLQQNQLALADSTTAVAADLVQLYRCRTLRGGWQPADAASPERTSGARRLLLAAPMYSNSMICEQT